MCISREIKFSREHVLTIIHPDLITISHTHDLVDEDDDVEDEKVYFRHTLILLTR